MSQIARRSVIAGLATVALATPRRAAAQSAAGYPVRPIRMIVPFPAGGAADITMRLVGPKMADALGQPLVIENRAGANGSIGATAVARADPDGHTLLFAPREVFSVNQSLQTKPGYDAAKDLAPVGIATEGPYVLIAHPSLGVKSMAEFLALARTKELTYASFGIGSMGHLNPEALAQHAGIKLLHVPYRGGAAALQAVVGGEVGFSISTPPNAQGFVTDGKVVALAIGAAKRMALMPDVPTLVELGLPADVLVPAAFAMAAPAATPIPIITRLNAELNRALAAVDVVEILAKTGLVAVGGSPDTMAKAVASDIARFGDLIRSLRIKPE